MNADLPLLESRTYSELLTLRAEAHGERPAYTFLLDGEKQSSTLTYAELHQRATAIAGWLQSQVEPGQRVLLVLPQGLDFLTAFFGCLHAGVIAVPAYPPRKNKRASRILAMVDDADISVVLSSADVLQQIEGVIADEPALAALAWQAVDELDDAWSERWQQPVVSESAIAFLQYTSGSTGTPKGVMVSHENLLHNQKLIRASFRQPLEATVCGWLPLHHDMGLIGNALHPIYLGGQLVFMSPIDFLQKPIRWLKAISQHQATIAGAPNFAYRLCVDEISPEQCEAANLDLHSWQVAFNGAEPVRVDSMRAFAEKFSPYGFREEMCTPCYGMAETTLIVTGAINGESLVTATFDPAGLEQGRVAAVESSKNQGTELAACGIPDASMDVRIVDPETRKVCEADRIGEIWVAGKSVAGGYWQREAETRETFRAFLAADADRDTATNIEYLRTGDLGFFHEDQLYITGRLKDMIIARGANHYPHDIERTVESSHPALLPAGGAAFGLEIAGQDEEQVVVIQELRRAQMRSIDPQVVIAAIRAAVSDEHQLSLHAVVLVRPGSIPKTTSGKTQRRQARKIFLEAGYKVVGQWHAADGDLAMVDSNESDSDSAAAVATKLDEFTSPAERTEFESLKTWLLERISHRLGISPSEMDVDQPFARYGMNSVTAVRLSGELSDKLGKKVSPTLAYEYSTVATLAYYLTTGRAPTANANTSKPKRNLNQQQPLAVVGIGCRFPGADNPAAFWDLLAGGKSAIGEPLTLRWPKDDAIPSRGGYLKTVDQFDAPFFGISPREADFIDPQHRLLLEVTWEAFEDAGIPIDSLAGSETGVFIGAGSNDYLRLQVADGLEVNGYSATGNSTAMVANRLSYTFDFRGPSLTIDTACSASLVAVHQAAKALQRGECEVAVAGGVNLILSSDTTSSFTQAGMLSPDGVCRAFAEGANGFVRGEGCGVVILKPLDQAVADGNTIYAVVRGSAVNQDGRSNGLTAPNPLSQQALLRAAVADANIAASDLDYLEAHGTGTELGDPIEMSAIIAVLANESIGRQEKLRVGSVKTNIGHLEAAAGIAGFIKTCLSLSNNTIPPHLNFEQPSSHIDWSQPVQPPTEPIAWQRSKRPRLAGVSSFGFGGANAHVILAESPKLETPASDLLPTTNLLTLSARTESALQAVAQQLVENASLWQHPAELCVAAATQRSHLKHRLAVPINFASAATVRKSLQEFATGNGGSGLVTGSTDKDAKTFWLFSGQGGHYLGVGKELYKNNSVFREQLDTVAASLSNVWPTSLFEILWQEAEAWNRVDVQPAIYCLQVALARTWLQFGVKPAGVAGHSFGEYAAACIAGLFSFEEGLKLVTRRAKLVESLKVEGGMLAVFADEATVREALPNLGQQIDIAAINGPKQTVIAGSETALGKTESLLKQKKFTVRRLQTTHGFHSPLVDPILSPFEKAASEVKFQSPTLTFISSQTGEVANDTAGTASYWRGNLRKPVRFFDTLAQIVALGGTHCLEIGAGSTLTSLTRSSRQPVKAIPGLLLGEQEVEKFLVGLAELYVAGATIEWPRVFGISAAYSGSLPKLSTYPFERQRHWFSKNAAAAGSIGNSKVVSGTLRGEATSHPLLGRKLDLGLDQIVFETQLSADSYLADHRVRGAIVFPAAGYLELTRAAAANVLAADKPICIRNFKIGKPLVIPEAGETTLQIILSPEEGSNQWNCRFVSRSTDSAGKAIWEKHATGVVTTETAAPIDLHAISSDAAELSLTMHYERSEEIGLGYGDAFRGLESLAAKDDTAWGRVQLPAALDAAKYGLHPALLDVCLQVTAGAVGERYRRGWLPVGFDSFQLLSDIDHTQPLDVVAELRTTADEDILKVDLQISSADQVVASVQGMTLKATIDVDIEDAIYREVWVPSIRRAEPLPKADQLDAAKELAALRSQLDRKQQALIADVDADRAMEMLDALEVFSGECTSAVLAKLGFDFATEDRFTAESLAADLGVADAHLRLLRRMLAILAEERVLSRDAKGWCVAHAPKIQQPSQLAGQLQQKFPEAAGELALITRCVTNLPDVMRGEVEPLPLLFPADGGVSAADVYRDSVGGKLLNALAADAVLPKVQSLKAGRGLRILEVGAGTGGTTGAILPLLPADRTQYLFTDISAGFMTPAKTRFRDYDFVDYKVLDIERDPADQGFDLGTFDIVIAANVLHATKDLGQTMEHVRKLLTAGGTFIAIEGTMRVRWLDLTFGLTPGWWRFEDVDRRGDYPLLSPARWSDLLTETGFAPPMFVDPLKTAGSMRQSENAVIVAELADHTASERAATTRRWLVSTPNGDPLTTSAEALPNAKTIAWNGQTIDADLSAANPTDVLFAVGGEWCEDASPVALTEKCQNALLAWLQAIIRWDQSREITGDPLRVWLVTQGATTDALAGDQAGCQSAVQLASAALWGMMRAVALEQPAWECLRVDLPAGADAAATGAILADELTAYPRDAESEIAFREERRLARRIASAKDLLRSQRKNAQVLKIANRGSLAGLELQTQRRKTPTAGQLEIEVVASGMNFRDVLNALGLYPTQPPLGAECTGIVTRVGEGVTEFQVGDRVAAIQGDSICDLITVGVESVVKLPKELDLFAAATMPIAFLTASVAMEELGKLKAGDNVLIHSAAGGVGMAAIQIAKAKGAEIFATASVTKHALVKSLGVEHVFDSRSEGFAEAIQSLTGGVGVDVVLNSLDDSFAEANLRALAKGGRYLDIAKSSKETVSKIASARADVQYVMLDLSEMIAAEPAKLSRNLEQIYAQAAKGIYQPLPYETFPLADAVEAFRHMRSGKHTGKLLVVTQTDAEAVSHPRAKPSQQPAFRNDATYLITGGLGDLGLLTADWILQRGGKHVALMARRNPSIAEMGAIESLEAKGGKITLLKADVTDQAAVTAACEQIRQSKFPLRGVFHLAGTLDDGLIANQSPEKFAQVRGPKVDGIWNLHSATHSDELDYFVMYSSVAAFLGSPGQANHSSANAFMDAFATYRRSQNLAASTLNWGPWAQIGKAAALDVGKRVDLGGVEMITPEEGLKILDLHVSNGSVQLAGVRIQVDQLPNRLANWPFFALLRAESAASTSGVDAKWLAEFKAAPPEERVELVLGLLRKLVGGALGIEKYEQIPGDEALFDLGLDSLTALELAGSLQVVLKVKVMPVEFFNYPTLLTLAKRLVELSFEHTLQVPSPPKSVGPNQQGASHQVPSGPVPPSQSQQPEQAKFSPTLDNLPEQPTNEVSDLLDDIQQLSEEFDRWEAN